MDDSEFGGKELKKSMIELSHEAKFRELLRNLNSAEIKLSSDASKEFIKLIRGHDGGELLREYVRTSSKCSELTQAWKLHKGKPGLSYVFSVISAILSHRDGIYKANDVERIGISRALDKFARSIIEENLGDIYKELNSKEGTHQNAALLLLASIVRRSSGLALDVVKNFDFKIPILPKLAEYKQKKFEAKRKHSTRRSFVGFAMSFLEVGKPGLLRWVLQQKEMYSGVLRGLGNDDDETVVYVLSTLRDRILTPESLVPPGLRSVLFGSVTLDQLISISGREDSRVAAELAHSVLIVACSDPSNGLMPDLERHPSPLRGNPKRLLDLMKKLKATEIDYHRDLLLAIVKGRPLFGSAYLDEFPYNLEDHASPIWLAAVSLAADLICSVGSSLPFAFLNSRHEGPPSFNDPNMQSVIKCIAPRSFTRLVINKGLLHISSLVKHGTLRLVFEELKLFVSFISSMESNLCSGNQLMQRWVSLKQEIQNEVRIMLPDTQVLLSLLSSLSTHYKSFESCVKRKADSEMMPEQNVNTVKKLKTATATANEEIDILVSGVCSLPDIALPGDTGVVEAMLDVDDLNYEDDRRKVIADIWGLQKCSMRGMGAKDGETHFYSKLLDTLKAYHRTMPASLEGSFDFFKLLPSNPLILPTILQHSLLSLLIELFGCSSNCKVPVRAPPLMYKHLHSFIKLLLYSPISDIKNQAHTLAQAAMLSTGAFDKNPREIDMWFLFLPGYSIENSFAGDQGTEEFQKLFSVVVSFLCDVVSTTGNNLLKYWDILRCHTYHLKRVGDVSPEFSPLIICVLEKCLRVLSSESGTFTLPEKSMISLYVSSTIKYLLQTQVEAGLLSSLVDLLLSKRIEDYCSLDGNAQDLCEWRPLQNLLIFSHSIKNQQICPFSSFKRKVVHADSSFVNVLSEVKRVVSGGSDQGLVGITKAFMLSIMSTPPAVFIENFPSVISVSKNLFGVPFSLLLAIFFLEPYLLSDVSKLWPDMFFAGLERAVAMVHGKERNEELIGDVDIDSIRSASAAFCFFLKQAPFHVLFPATVSIDGLHLLDSKLQDLLQAKLSERTTDNFISSVLLVLFWFHQIQLLYRSKPLPELEQLSGTCSILLDKMLAQVKVEQPDSGLVIVQAPSLPQCILEVAEVILCHPVVMLLLEYPLGSYEEFTEGIIGESLESFLLLTRQGIHKMDHHGLNLLASISEHMLTFYNAQSSLDYTHKSILKALKALVKKLKQIFRDRFDLCIKTEDLKLLAPTLYALHTVMHFISPLELLELVLWMFSTIDLSDSTLRVSFKCSALSVGLLIAGCAFDMLSAYLQLPYSKQISHNIFWGIEEKSFDVLLFEDIYFHVIEIGMRFELNVADLCLLKAVNVANIRKGMQNQSLTLSVDMSRVILNTPIKMLSQCILQTSMARAKILFLLTEVSPFHLLVFGHLFSDLMNNYLLPEGKMVTGTCNHALSDDKFMMLLPTALSYLNSTFMKYGEQFYKCARNISSFYFKILLRSFSDWKSYVSGDMFKVEYTGLLAPSMEELLDLLSGGLLGKAILMIRYYFALKGDTVPMKKRLMFFISVCPHSDAHDDILDSDVTDIDAYSFEQSLNLVNRVVAKLHFCRMLLFPKDNPIQSLLKEDGNKGVINAEGVSNKEDSARIRFMNILVRTWQLIVKNFPSKTKDSGIEVGTNYFLFRFLEAFIGRNLLELTREMHYCLNKMDSLPFIEQLARNSLLHRFADPATLKMLRGVLATLSDGNLDSLVLQLLLAHSQFAPTIHCVSTSAGGSQVGVVFRPMASIMRLLVFRSTNRSALGGDGSSQKASEQHMKQLEVVKLLRALLHFKAQESGFDFEKDIGAKSRELLFLLLASYSATISELDLEIYNLMLDIESADKSNSTSIAEMDYLWGSAAMKIVKEREQEQDLSSDQTNDIAAVEERRRTQFRENLPIDPKLCAYTVLHFPYARTVGEVQHGNSACMIEKHHESFGKIRIYDPVFLLRLAIHSLSMGYIEPIEFASLGLLAVAFVCISSPDDKMRKLGYDALGRFKSALEMCQKRKDIMRLRLLLTFLQNGIDEQWQRIPSITAMFVSEASFILLDPSHDHYSTISKHLMRSPRVNLKCIPLFQELFWSSSVNFRTDRLWMLRLLYAGLNSDDDAQMYIRNNILESILGFYASSLSDNESKELILQVVKKSVKLHRMARYLVEHCGMILWLSSIVSVSCGKQDQDQTNFQLTLLITVLEVVNDVISSSHTVEWLQQFALEQLSELSTHLFKLLVGGSMIEQKGSIVSLILQILISTMKISQKRKVYEPHFTLSLEGLFQIYKVVSACSNGDYSPSAELGLQAILMSTPPFGILSADQVKVLKFVTWAISTALQSNSAKTLQPKEACWDSLILLEAEDPEDSLVSKLLRWLTASVILGSLSWRSINLDWNSVCERSDPETLQSLLELYKKGCEENQPGFGCGEILASSIFHLQQLLGMNCKLLPSVVSALCLLLLSDFSQLAEMDGLLGNENTLASLCSTIRCPVEANPTWRWSFYQPWKDLSSNSTDYGKMDELHACQSLLVVISNVISKKSLHSRILSLEEIENSGVFDWERSILESK